MVYEGVLPEFHILFCIKSDTLKWGISMFQMDVGFYQLGQHQK